MSIYREERKVLWNRKNDENTHNQVTLEAVSVFQLAIHNLLSGDQTLLSEQQFFEMVEAGAKHFGKQVTIEDLPIPCPVCKSPSVLLPHHNRFLRTCPYCNFWSPKVDSPEKADLFFARLEVPQSLADEIGIDRREP